ncbi:MAG: hypothetical protein WC831_05665 [Parcubacteria group bacterium]|jgi:hypothetical protein
MTRRTKKEKKSLLGKNFKAAKKSASKSAIAESFNSKKSGKERANLRFSVSLIILTAVLELAIFIFLISLISSQNIIIRDNSAFYVASANGNNKTSAGANQDLNDPSFDFTLRIPSQIGDWKYKAGFVKSPVDDALSNQYLQLYLSDGGEKKSRDLDKINKTFLTIRKFSSEEWEEMENGCQKGNETLCEAAGEKITEKDESVYAYTKTDDCSGQKKDARCVLADKIVGSFKFK